LVQDSFSIATGLAIKKMVTSKAIQGHYFILQLTSTVWCDSMCFTASCCSSLLWVWVHPS